MTKTTTCTVCSRTVEYSGMQEKNDKGEVVLQFHYFPRSGRPCRGSKLSPEDIERQGLAAPQAVLDLGPLDVISLEKPK